jgi:hypothetical protein
MDMTSEQAAFRRIAGISTIVAAAVGGVSAYLFLAFAEYRFERVISPGTVIKMSPSSGELLRWGALTDMLSYYLLFVPLVLCVGRELRRRHGAIVDITTVAGVMYASIGALAAVVLATAGPLLMDAYQEAGTGDRAGLELAFRTLTAAVATGAWQTLEIIPLGVWAVGTGIVQRARSASLGNLGVTLGVVALAGSTFRMLYPHSASLLFLSLAGVFGALFWTYVLWMAYRLLTGADL